MDRSWWKVAGGLLVVAAVGIQFVPVDRTNPPVDNVISAPADVDSVLRRACWDCHSNRTEWPWYSHVAPVSWYVARDVHQGREHMNFTEWPTDPEEARDLIGEIGDQVESGAMPPTSYRIMHPEARLSGESRQVLIDWSMASGGLDRLPDDLPGED